MSTEMNKYISSRLILTKETNQFPMQYSCAPLAIELKNTRGNLNYLSGNTAV